MTGTINELKNEFLLDIEECEQKIEKYEQYIEQNKFSIMEFELSIDKNRKKISIMKQLIENLDDLKDKETES
jgi:hypothetical protein